MSWLRLMEESIQEDDELSGGKTALIQRPGTRKKHSFAGLIKEMWPAYLIEMIVIILGISITLALEEWRDGKKEDKLENIYRKNLLGDVDKDLHSLKYASFNTEKLLAHGNELLGFIRNPDKGKVSPGLVNADVREILSRPKFISSDATFTDLKSSGNLHLIKDIGLKNLLFAYYNETQIIREGQDAEQQATISISGSYFLKRFPVNDELNQKDLADQENIPELLKSIEFGNNVQLRVSLRNELLGIYQSADSLAILLKENLGKEPN